MEDQNVKVVNVAPQPEVAHGGFNTTELVKMLVEQDLTDTEAYNQIIADLFDFVPAEQIEQGQRLVAYFMYKIQAVCMAALREAKSR